MSTTIRPIRPFSRIKGAWLWDNLYCVWRQAAWLRTGKEALLCGYTHFYAGTKPRNEPT